MPLSAVNPTNIGKHLLLPLKPARKRSWPLTLIWTWLRPRTSPYGMHKSTFRFTYFIIWQFVVITNRASTQKRAFNGSIVTLYNQQFRCDSTTLAYTTPAHVKLRRFDTASGVVARSLDTPWNHHPADSGEPHPAHVVTCIWGATSNTFSKCNFPPWAVVTQDVIAVCANAGYCVRTASKAHDRKEYKNHAADKNRRLTGKERTRPHKKKKGCIVEN